MQKSKSTELTSNKKRDKSLEMILSSSLVMPYTTAILSILATALLGWYAIRPTLQTILHLKREIADKTKLDLQMDQKITQLIESRDAYQEVENILPALSLALPEDPDFISIALQLQNIAQEVEASVSAMSASGIPIFKTDEKQNKIDKELAEVVIPLSVKGTHRTLISFLDKLIIMRRIVTINDITLSPQFGKESIETTSSANILLTLNVTTYFIR